MASDHFFPCPILAEGCEWCPFECTFDRPMCHAYACGYCRFSDKESCARGWHIPWSDYLRREKLRKRAKRGSTETESSNRKNLMVDLRRLGLPGPEIPERAEVNAAYKSIHVRGKKMSEEEKFEAKCAWQRILCRIAKRGEACLQSDSHESASDEEKRLPTKRQKAT